MVLEKGGISITKSGQHYFGVNRDMVMLNRGRMRLTVDSRKGRPYRKKVNEVAAIFGSKIKGFCRDNIFIVSHLDKLNKRRDGYRRGHKTEKAVEPSKDRVLGNPHGIKKTSMRFGCAYDKRE